MKVKELKELLNKYDDNLPLSVVVSYIDRSYCSCDEYCYCSETEHDFEVNGVSVKEEYNRKTKKQEIVNVVITGS